MNKRIAPMALAAILSLHGCATSPQLSENEALSSYETLSTLQEDFNASDKALLSVLSQTSYTKATEALDEAKTLAMKNNDEASATALQGKRYLDEAKRNMVLAQDVFAEVLTAREQALNSGAGDLAPDAMRELESDFKELALKLEQGQVEAAKIRRPEMIRRYSALEVTSVKRATVDNAKNLLIKAKTYGAAKYAPKTYGLAENELAIAVKLIEGDRTRTAEAQKHVKKAIELAEQAMGITDSVKEFRENRFTFEEVVLWHQDQLKKAVKPLTADLKVNRPPHHIIGEIQSEISALMADRNKLQEIAQRDKNQLEEKLVSLERDRQQKEELELARQKKLEFIQNLFDAQEANVYLQKRDVLIRAQGFYFPVGQSEIDSRNFALLQKIAKAIDQYPGATIMVTGHTDNTGNDSQNLSLSKDRAQKVAKFLNEFGGIDMSRIRVDGFGEGKPVESNDTAEGRAANRRVEILIQNNA